MMEKPEEKPTVPSPSQVEEGVEKALIKRDRAERKRMREYTKKHHGGRPTGVLMILGAIAYIMFGWFPKDYCFYFYLFGIIEFIGAVFAIQGRHWLFVLIAAILGLNIPAIIFLAFEWDEFKLVSGKLY